ncbi:hypothetical protein LOCC1_G006379 [Lachnellula occidentalis]|uniref:Uncharacterized protein n=1 Tax=Lachnellula occidentalis TaxID=215460 RepID=A0A8H8RNI9_9HELO|nr:hypothetical protein LOCC1_G006379 [Lachnellula occidentalis]
MSSNTANLPPYSENHPSKETLTPTATAGNIAGTVQTCSIRDFQVDYFTIVRNSTTSYHLSLTVDPTPLYRIQVVSSSTKISNIQIFPASNITLPAIAAARLSANPKSKNEPLATICTSSPTQPDALWRPLTRTGGMFSIEDYQSAIPIIAVPGRAAIPHQFSWRTGSLSGPFYQLWWDGPLPLVPSSMFVADQRGSEYVFATMARKTANGGENLVEIRRGGGMEFELSVILELFVILHFNKEQLI